MEEKNVRYCKPVGIEYTTDLTNLVYNGKSPTFIGREKELHRLIDILCKKNKNNPVLIGKPGVGKTALIYALAEKIVTNQVNRKLQDCSVLDFDIVGALAGSRYRGEFEERIKTTLENIAKFTDSGNKIILCIDEIHTIVGTGSAEGSIDLSTMLKPFLLNSSVNIIGTSTFNDYRTIESDKALERRFDTVTVNEPSFQETVRILTAHKQSFEQFHSVYIPENTIDTVINLSNRYIPERFLPDKAIDLLDEVCSIVANSSNTCRAVLPKDVFFAISLKKDIPINEVKNSYDLINLEHALSSRVIGQKHVFTSLATAVRRTKAGLNDENRPLASFMFIGPTGVGKTETAKALADLVFSGKDNIIRFDMSEYMEEHSVSKLIGAPPGYVGYTETGLLTEQVRRYPYSLVLFDEIEKAHPKIYNLLLQILDEGCLTDSKGEHINFKNTIIILTSNVGTGNLSKKSVGFIEESNSKSDVLSEVKKSFSPEFLNRLDEIILFNYLSKDDIFEIAKLHISDLVKKVNELNINIDISNEVIEKIAQLGYSKEYGARELRRTIDRELKNPLADLILQHNVNYIYVELFDEQITISCQKVAISI